MSIRKAETSDFETVKRITVQTISRVYPEYYSQGAVKFFIEHHSDASISDDIEKGLVYLCIDTDNHAVGTVTVRSNEICRLFVLPQFHGYGYGRELLDFSEALIAEKYNEIVLDSSLPAKSIYLNRGYVIFEYHTLKTSDNDQLSYEAMIKHLH